MLAMVLQRPAPAASGPLDALEVPEPVPGDGEVLIEVAACAVCRTDLQLCEGDLEARRLPVVPGHQIVGRVAAVGRGVRGWRVGDRAGVGWLAGACGTCRFCRAGRENLCERAAFTGWDRDGGYAAADGRARRVRRAPARRLRGPATSRRCSAAGSSATARCTPHGHPPRWPPRPLRLRRLGALHHPGGRALGLRGLRRHPLRARAASGARALGRGLGRRLRRPAARAPRRRHHLRPRRATWWSRPWRAARPRRDRSRSTPSTSTASPSCPTT